MMQGIESDEADQPSRGLTLEDQYFADLLPLLLAAVSQQFSHMLILRQLGQLELAAGIKEVDDVDFVSAMRIMDLLESRDRSLVLPSRKVFFGTCIASIFAAEGSMEDALNASLENAGVVESSKGRSLLERVRAPRARYGNWLRALPKRALETECDLATKKAVRALVSDLLQLMEQTMLNAFAYWHKAEHDAASASWQVSGAAMCYLTELAGFSGSADPRNGISLGGSIREARAQRATSEIQMLKRCAKTAEAAAFCCPDPDVAKTLGQIAIECDWLSSPECDPDVDFGLGYSRAFRDFGSARRRAVEGQDAPTGS